ncbi:MAG TPA: lyase family protein, partial [Aggregatilineales bacterium]|nr:lyase family protein [Aggregatilineales bacterium]
KIADAIIQASDEILSGQHHDHFVVDPFQAGAGTSHNMNVNEVIANRASQILGVGLNEAKKPVNPNDHVNMAQSTNDTIPTAIRLGVLWKFDELIATLQNCANEFKKKAKDWDDV